MATVWFVSRDEETRGPFTIPELRRMADSRELAPTDSVWNDAEQTRMPAGQLRDVWSDREESNPDGSQSEPRPSSIVLGVATVALGLLSSCVFGTFAYAAKDVVAPIRQLAVGLPAVLALLGVVHLVAGIGILSGTPAWSVGLAQATAMGIVIVVGLWLGYHIVHSPEQQGGMVITGVVAAIWAIAVNFGLNVTSDERGERSG